jgi:hypothetical protein
MCSSSIVLSLALYKKLPLPDTRRFLSLACNVTGSDFASLQICETRRSITPPSVTRDDAFT